jgi:hypothetical protein
MGRGTEMTARSTSQAKSRAQPFYSVKKSLRGPPTYAGKPRTRSRAWASC